MPRQRAGGSFCTETRSKRNISPAFDNWRQEYRQLRWAVAVITVEEDNRIRIFCIRKARQTCAPVSPAWFSQNASAFARSDRGSSIGRVAVYNEDLGDQIGRQVVDHTADGLRFIVGR